MVDCLVFPPALTFAELLTMTEVSGRPPISPEIILPKPCAFNSLLVGVTLFNGSNLSTASIPSNVSRDATIASVTADIHTWTLVIKLKLGSVKKEINSVVE